MTTFLALALLLLALALLARMARPVPEPDPGNVADLAWIRSLKHDADLDQAVEIGNYDRFKEWEKEVAA